MAEPDRAGAPVQIEITEKMLAAGTRALEECAEYPADEAHMVVEVLRAVFRTQAQQKHVKITVVFPDPYL